VSVYRRNSKSWDSNDGRASGLGDNFLLKIFSILKINLPDFFSVLQMGESI
jgi:hypothetical protein